MRRPKLELSDSDSDTTIVSYSWKDNTVWIDGYLEERTEKGNRIQLIPVSAAKELIRLAQLSSMTELDSTRTEVLATRLVMYSKIHSGREVSFGDLLKRSPKTSKLVSAKSMKCAEYVFLEWTDRKNLIAKVEIL